MFASLQLLNTPLNHHFSNHHQQPQQQQQQHSPRSPTEFHFFNPADINFNLPQQSPISAKTEELCLPPNLLFPSELDLDLDAEYDDEQDLMDITPRNRKRGRSPSPTPSASTSTSSKPNSHLPSITVKKNRTERGERISSKDFKAPDVTGLSKREARLVKNRAAAFLSRQRKREEFEALEIRVADLEAENVSLRSSSSSAAASSSKPLPAPTPSRTTGPSKETLDLQSEITRLKSELATSSRRSTLLEQDLARLRQNQSSPQTQTQPMTTDSDSEDQDPISSNASSSGEESSTKDRAASGLMMALLLLLAPALSSPSASAVVEQDYTDLMGMGMGNVYDAVAPGPVSFDSFDLGNGVDLASWTRMDAFEGMNMGYGSGMHIKEEDMAFDLSSPSQAAAKRAVELDVELIRDPSNPERVRVRLASSSSPTTSPISPISSDKFPADFLGTPALTSSSLSPESFVSALPNTYSYLDGREKKRVRIAVGESGEWEVEVKS